jgi:hypothetical protein
VIATLPLPQVSNNNAHVNWAERTKIDAKSALGVILIQTHLLKPICKPSPPRLRAPGFAI